MFHWSLVLAPVALWVAAPGWHMDKGRPAEAVPGAAELRTRDTFQDVHLVLVFRCERDCAGAALTLKEGQNAIRISLADADIGATTAPGQRLEVTQMPLPVAGAWRRLEITARGEGLSGWLDNKRIEVYREIRLQEPQAEGAIALAAPTRGRIEIRSVLVEPADLRRFPPETTGANFAAQQVDPLFNSETVAIADVNRDGHPDLVAGPRYYPGPDFTVSRAIYDGEPASMNGYSSAPLSIVADVTGDGFPDALVVRGGGPGPRPLLLFANPGPRNRSWKQFKLFESVPAESIAAADLDGDGLIEIATQFDGRIGYLKGDPGRPTAPWTFHPVSDAGKWGPHGMGLGDIDGDKRVDIVSAKGWWQQPASLDLPWRFHPYPFGQGADMLIADFDGDRLVDVASADDAHGWGLSWHRQVRHAGEISFERHPITGVPLGSDPAAFSELHALALADIDQDGLPDIVTGKRWWAHLDTGLDADPQGQPLLYWFKLVRTGGKVSFIAKLISNRAGVGNQIAVGDVDGDGDDDVVVSARRGTWVFRSMRPKEKQRPDRSR
ncbi:MAG TPA: VCBS repeat-containing protein [Sphingomonas sp.]|nr:VCBS repeat-containing protein [Sphingomonas sp.]